ncbi:MAG: hypothetical protein AB2L16_08315 [Anaerolineaceae bacterium]
MSEIHALSITQAQQLMLAGLGLLTKPRKKATKADLLTAIRRIYNLQIDTISVATSRPYPSKRSDYWVSDNAVLGTSF